MDLWRLAKRNSMPSPILTGGAVLRAWSTVDHRVRVRFSATNVKPDDKDHDLILTPEETADLIGKLAAALHKVAQIPWD